MKSRQLIALSIGFILVTVLFQNCSDKFEGQGNINSLSLCKLSQGSQARSPFEYQKVILDDFSSNSASASSLQKLGGSSSRYALTINVSCFNELESPVMFLGQEIQLTQKQSSSSMAILNVNLDQAQSLSEIELEMATSPCFIGLSNDKELKLSQANLTPIPVNDPQSGQQLHLNYLGYQVSRAIQTEITSSVIVAVIDTGIADNHADLDSRMWTDPQGNHGWNYVNNNRNTLDDNGHGTHVAGIIGAIENNSYGVSGLTGAYVELMAMKALSSAGTGLESDIAQAMIDAVDNGADVINLSVEQRGRVSSIENAMAYAINNNVTVVTAAGNQAERMTLNNLFGPGYLGSQYNGVINVASVNINSVLSNFSNFGSAFAEIASIGTYYTGENQTSWVLSTSPGNGWARMRGTSQATPMVASAAAMMIGYLKTRNIPYNNAGVESFIKSDGSGRSSNLAPYVEDGNILHMGFLAQNLVQYILDNPNPDFQGEVSTGNTCFAP